MQASILDQGLTLMLVGMGTVFVFLSVLVLAMSAMSAIAQRLLPQEQATADGVPGDDEIAAITVAINQHRSRQR